MNQSKIKSIHFNNSIELHLSIQLSLDGFSFCIIDKESKEVQKLVHFGFKNTSPTPEVLLKNVKEVFNKEKSLQKRYGSVNISHVNQLSSLVPKSLFDEDRIKDYIKYSSKTFDNDYIVHDEIENHNIINVYIPFVNVNNYLLERFGSFEYKHFSTILITTLLDTYKFSEHPHLFTHISENHFEIVIIAKERLLLYNSFKYETKEDFIYYVLFSVEQLQLNPEKLDMMLSGLVTQESDLYQMAYKYIRKVSLLENRSSFVFPKHIKETERRRHFTLLNQY